MAALGFVVGLVEFLLIAIGIRSTRLELPVLVAAVALSAIGFLIAAVVGRLLADAVARTGVLANTPLSQTLGEV